MTRNLLTALTLTVGLIAGCGIDPNHLGTDCAWAEPIRTSRQDVMSDTTLSQIVAHNDLGAQLCGWEP